MADAETLSGSVVLREPAALPAGPLLTVTLEDVSPADAAAVTLAHKRFEVKDQLAPIRSRSSTRHRRCGPDRTTPLALG